MALPWLIGAAAVATVGYLASSSSSSGSSSNYDSQREDAEEREAERREEERTIEKNNFKEKWGVSFKSDVEESSKIKDINKEISKIDEEIDVLESYLVEVVSL